MTAPSSASTRSEPAAAAVDENADREISDGVVQALGNEYVSTKLDL